MIYLKSTRQDFHEWSGYSFQARFFRNWFYNRNKLQIDAINFVDLDDDKRLSNVFIL